MPVSDQDGAPPFADRRAAGRALATALVAAAGRPDLLVLGLPRGGVPVAYEVARALDTALDVFLVRKLGVPGHEELAMGAIATGGVRVVNEEVVAGWFIPAAALDRVAAAEGQELERQEHRYRDGRPPPDLTGRTVILVDDGLATGSTMRAAARAVRAQAPRAVIIAVPVAPSSTVAVLRPLADEVVCLITPHPFFAVGCWYEDFSQTPDENVSALLTARERERTAAAGNAAADRGAAAEHAAARRAVRRGAVRVERDVPPAAGRQTRQARSTAVAHQEALAVVDKETDDLIMALASKLEGLAAYNKYQQNRQANAHLWQQLRQQDEQAVRQLLQQVERFAREGKLTAK